MDIMEYVFTIVAIVYAIVCRISGHIDLTSEENAIQGKQLTFVCKTTTLSNTVTFFNPQSSIAGSCIYPEYKCDSGYGYKLSQDISSLRTFLTIDHLNRSLHQGIWKCNYGQEQAQMNLSVITFPDTVMLEGLKTDIDLTNTPPETINITCSCSCVYPNAVFTLSLKEEISERELKSHSYNKQRIDSSFTCNDQLENRYISEFILSIKNDLPLLKSTAKHIKCNVAVSALKAPLFGMSIGRLIFPAASTTNVSNTTSPNMTNTRNENGVDVEVIVGCVLGFVCVAIIVVTLAIICRRRTGMTEQKNDKQVERYGRQSSTMSRPYHTELEHIEKRETSYPDGRTVTDRNIRIMRINNGESPYQNETFMKALKM